MIQSHQSKIKIVVIGLGYVGLPLAIEFSKKYTTVGFDNNEVRLKELNSGLDRTLEITKKELISSNLLFCSKLKDISDCNVFIVTVPTPVDEYNVPDMSPLKKANESIAKVLKKNDIIIYESTVYPGATEEFCVPILEKESGLKYNKDFYCGYSPERINPGDKDHTLTTITKITSGSNKSTSSFVDKLYKSIIPAGTHNVSSIAVAEAAKVIENIQRDVNISLVNELSMIFNRLDLDTNEVLKAAGTKWNFLPFRPGLVGGHCIGVDPYYLTYKCAQVNYHPEIILAGRRINDSMGKYIADSVIIEMTKSKINPIGAKVGILGITFKEDCPDLRNTKVPDIINHLLDYGCAVQVFDPYADKKQAIDLYGINLSDFEEIEKFDVLIGAVAHREYKNISKKTLINQFNQKGVFIDVKSMYSSDFFIDTHIKHWRL